MRRNQVSCTCEQCGITFSRKASHPGRFCSLACKADNIRRKPKANPRACEVCAGIFTPSPKRGEARFCSKACIWVATKGPAFNARIAKETASQRGARQRGTGTKGYVKLDGRHEHRVVAEHKLGRPLLPKEVVHHLDEDKHNNSPDNLAVMSQGRHMREHGLAVPGVTPWWKPWEKRWVK